MWTIEPADAAGRILAKAALVAAVVAFLLAQEVGLRLRREEHRAWWAGSGRDLLNAAGLVAVAGALRLGGLAWAAALLVGGSLTLAMFGASVLVGTQLETSHPRAWSFAVGAVIALPALVWPGEVLEAFAGVAEALFGDGAR